MGIGLTRRSVLAGAALLSGSHTVQATNAYPIKPIQFLVPFTPGGGADAVARLTSADVSERLHRQVVIENRPGAGGNIAAQVVAHARPDGYTLLEGNLAHAVAMSLYAHPTYNIITDFAPIIKLGSVPFVLCASALSGIRTTAELIAMAKAQPGKLNYASSGIGGPSHLAMELFKQMAGIEMVHVPYQGAAPAVADLMAGRVQTGFLTVAAVQPALATGSVRALGVSTAQPIASLPGAPAIAQSGLPGYAAETWFGVMAPVGTSADIIAVLHDSYAASLSVPETQKRLHAEGFEPGGGSPQEFAAYIAAETRKWAPIVAASGAMIP